MVSKAVLKCRKIMLYLARQGFTNQVTKRELQKAIVVLAGADPRTFKRWEQTLKLLEYIEEVGYGVYRLNYAKVPEALQALLKEGGEQKKLM